MKDNNVIDEKNMKILKEEILERMESASWDFNIAHKVIENRNLKRETIINRWSIASLATAAMAFLVFIGSIYTATSSNSTGSGTGSIYSYAYIKDSSNLDNDVIAAGLELTINEAYPMR